MTDERATTDPAADGPASLVLLERHDRVALVRLNRPQALNALNEALAEQLCDLLEELDADAGVGAIVLTGSAKAFAAGADITEMADRSAADLIAGDLFAQWQRLTRIRTPIIAAVAGYALGGGCELAMMCDLLIAADSARFGQPEINLGVVPGMGGTQRMARAIGKAKTMDLVLTGRFMDAAEAERSGLVSRVVPAAELEATALEVAGVIASKSLPVARAAVELVDQAFETPLAQGLLLERRVFHSLFALDDQTEGMAAFVEKRTPEFRHR